jgi:hypothetical protein
MLVVPQMDRRPVFQNQCPEDIYPRQAGLKDQSTATLHSDEQGGLVEPV